MGLILTGKMVGNGGWEGGKFGGKNNDSTQKNGGKMSCVAEIRRLATGWKTQWVGAMAIDTANYGRGGTGW